MTDRRHSLGAEGEARAAAHLARAGYRIVARNVRAGGVEIDLVALRRDLVVFVEVKTRSSAALGPPEEAVGARQQARLLRAAAAWLHEHRPAARRVRFDVVACTRAPDGSWALRHWPDAFDAGG